MPALSFQPDVRLPCRQKREPRLSSVLGKEAADIAILDVEMPVKGRWPEALEWIKQEVPETKVATTFKRPGYF